MKKIAEFKNERDAQKEEKKRKIAEFYKQRGIEMRPVWDEDEEASETELPKSE